MFYYRRMLGGYRYRLELKYGDAVYLEQVAGTCRALWNVALEQRRGAVEINRGRAQPRCVWPSMLTQRGTHGRQTLRRGMARGCAARMSTTDAARSRARLSPAW